MDKEKRKKEVYHRFGVRLDRKKVLCRLVLSLVLCMQTRFVYNI